MGFFPIRRQRPTPESLSLGDFSLHYDRSIDGWMHDDMEFWGFREVAITVDADEAGLRPHQVAEYRRLAGAKDELLPRLLEALRSQETESATFVLVGIHIPRLDGTKAGELARFWFDRTGDDHYMYGVESSDRWLTMQAHRDD
jgi:hypothetical protein